MFPCDSAPAKWLKTTALNVSKSGTHINSVVDTDFASC